LVLCYLNGLTNEEAARRLGWPTGSISYRLARGREILRDRLCSVAPLIPPAFVAALPVLYSAPVLALLPRLMELATKSAILFSEGESIVTLVSANAITATQDELRRQAVVGWSKPAFVLAASLLVLLTCLLGRPVLAARLAHHDSPSQTVASPCHAEASDTAAGRSQ